MSSVKNTMQPLSQAAEATIMVKTSPDALRELANQLENRSRYALPGQTIVARLAPSITLTYEPQRSLEKFVQNLAEEFVKRPEIKELNGTTVDL